MNLRKKMMAIKDDSNIMYLYIVVGAVEALSGEAEKMLTFLAAVTIAVDDSTNAIVSITQTSEQLSRNAESLKQDADKNLMIADALKNESGKFKI